MRDVTFKQKHSIDDTIMQLTETVNTKKNSSSAMTVAKFKECHSSLFFTSHRYLLKMSIPVATLHQMSILILALLHTVMIYYAPNITPATRWIFIHAVINVIVTTLTVKHVMALFQNIHVLYNDSSYASQFPILLVTWSHLYHVIFYRLTVDDLLHHVIFIPCIAIPGCFYKWGGYGNLQLFFICGLPGFIIYTTILLKKITYV